MRIELVTESVVYIIWHIQVGLNAYVLRVPFSLALSKVSHRVETTDTVKIIFHQTPFKTFNKTLFFFKRLGKISI